MVMLYRKFRHLGCGRARNVLSRVFNLSPKTISSWVKGKSSQLSRRSDRHGGWKLPFFQPNYLSSEKLVSIHPQSERIQPRSVSGLVSPSVGIFSSRGALCASIARSMNNYQESSACRLSQPLRASGQHMRPTMPTLLEDDGRRFLFLPLTSTDATLLHQSYHSSIYVWRWAARRDAVLWDTVDYIIKAYHDRVPYLYERRSFLAITACFCNRKVEFEKRSLFSFPVAESNWTLRESEGITVQPILVFHRHSNFGIDQVALCIRQNYSYVFEILRQLLQAVSVVHAAGLVHCDIKPGNLLVQVVAGSVHVRLIDFSCAHELGTTGSRTGTPGYRALEVLQPKVTAFRWSPKQDLFSCAVTVLSLAAGKGVIRFEDSRNRVAEVAAVKEFIRNPYNTMRDMPLLQEWEHCDRKTFLHFSDIIVRMVSGTALTAVDCLRFCDPPHGAC